MLLCFFYCALIAPPSAFAADLLPGAYVTAPAGTTINALFYFYSERDKQYLHGQRVPNHPQLDSGIWVGKFSRYFKLGENTVNLALILPAGSLHGGKDTLALGRASGVGDATLVGGYWFVDKPEIRKYVGVTAFLTLPTGTYDKRKALNLGENRWKAVLQGAVNAGVSPKVDIDLDADVAVYGHNNEFGAAGATMTQDPSYQLQTFLRYHFSPAFDVASGVSYVWGGETQVNGIRKYNAARTSKLVLFGGYMIGPRMQLAASYQRDLSVENGFFASNTVVMRLSRVF